MLEMMLQGMKTTAAAVAAAVVAKLRETTLRSPKATDEVAAGAAVDAELLKAMLLLREATAAVVADPLPSKTSGLAEAAVAW